MGKIVGNIKFEKPIKRMLPGEEGYTLPWALSFDQMGNAWLNTAYSVHGNKGGTVSMKIKRTGVERTDYEIDTNIDHEWSVGKALYFGTDERDIVLIGNLLSRES